MYFMKSNAKYATPVANLYDIHLYSTTDTEVVRKEVAMGNVKYIALIQRLVNSSYLPEGKY